MKMPLIVKKQGLYCPEGDFFIDAWAPVSTCLITHAHADHARYGHKKYISTEKSLELLRHRLGANLNLQTFPYNHKLKMNNCWVSFHPAGHVLGSAQIRIESENTVCVVSGDYKRALDDTCDPFELIKCDTFISESTFALPIYNWEPSEDTAKAIYDWWMDNRSRGLCSIIFCYALGKAQRIMSLLSKFSNDPVYLHGSIENICNIYIKNGISLIPFLPVTSNASNNFQKDLIIAPPSAKNSPWMKRFYPYRTAFASGWMQVRGARKQRNVDRGFVLSDHADWAGLLRTIKETEASQILTTHGNAEILARYLSENGLNAQPLHGLEILEEGED